MTQRTPAIVPENLQTELEKQTTAQWRRWIAKCLQGLPVSPDVPLGDEERDQILIGVFRELHEKQNFLDATSSLLDSMIPSSDNTEQFYFLLQAISMIRPPGCSPTLQRYLEERRFEGLFHRQRPLDYLALSVRCDYASDESLIDFLISSFERRSEWSYKLLCFRQLSRLEEDKAFSLLELLLPLLPETEASDLGRALQGYAWRKGFRRIFSWYIDYDSRTPASDRSFIILRELLSRFVVPRSEDTEEDAFYILLSARLHSTKNPFAAEEIVKIANTVRDPRLVEQQDVVVETLRHVWDQNMKLIPQLATGESSFPWIEKEFQAEHGARHLVETHWTKDLILSRPSRTSPLQSVDLDPRRDTQTISAIVAATGPNNLLFFVDRNAAVDPAEARA